MPDRENTCFTAFLAIFDSTVEATTTTSSSTTTTLPSTHNFANRRWDGLTFDGGPRGNSVSGNSSGEEIEESPEAFNRKVLYIRAELI